MNVGMVIDIRSTADRAQARTLLYRVLALARDPRPTDAELRADLLTAQLLCTLDAARAHLLRQVIDGFASPEVLKAFWAGPPSEETE